MESQKSARVRLNKLMTRIVKLDGELTMHKATLRLTLALFVTGCAPALISERAICDAIQPQIRSHATALANDGGPISVQTGARLIRSLDAGCAL